MAREWWGRVRGTDGRQHMTGEPQLPGSDQILAPPAYIAEPSTGDHTGAIDQRLQFNSFCADQRLTVKLRGQGLVFGGPTLSNNFVC